MHTRKVLSELTDDDDDPMGAVLDSLTPNSAHTSFTFEGNTTQYPNLIQVTDGYVVHARGFTVEDKIWVDEYAVRGGHCSLWDQVIADEVGGEYDERHPHQVLYWSVTGAGKFIMQHPRWEKADDEAISRTAYMLRAFGVPGDVNIAWETSSGHVFGAASDLYATLTN